jgi:ADP-heptose:LPS heptosyltransferase
VTASAVCFSLRFDNPYVQGGLGDMLALEFYMRHIRKTLGEPRILLVTDAAIAARHGQFFRCHSVVEAVIVCPAIGVWAPWQWLKFYLRMRRERCSLLLVGGARNPFGLQGRLCGIPERIGIPFCSSEARFLTRHVRLSAHDGREPDLLDYVSAYTQAMGFTEGTPPAVSAPQFIYRAENPRVRNVTRPIVACHIGGSHHFNRRWPPEHFAQLCCRVASELKGSIYLVGGADEREDCEAIQRAVLSRAPQAIVLNLTGASLDHTANHLANANVFVGNDSGMLHLAAALAVPSVGVFGPSNPGIWQRAYPKLRVVSAAYSCHRSSISQTRHQRRRISCVTHRCAYAFDPVHPSYTACLQAVTVDDVWQQLCDVLSYGKESSNTCSGSSR